MTTEENVYNLLIENNKNLDNIVINEENCEYFFDSLYKLLNNNIFDENNKKHIYLFVSNMTDIFFPQFKYNVYQNKWYYKKDNLDFDSQLPYYPRVCSHLEPIKELTPRDIRIFLQYILYKEITKYCNKLQHTSDNEVDANKLTQNIDFLINISEKCKNGDIFLKFMETVKLLSI